MKTDELNKMLFDRIKTTVALQKDDGRYDCLKELFDLMNDSNGDYVIFTDTPLIILNNSITIMNKTCVDSYDKLGVVKLFLGDQMAEIRQYLEKYLTVNESYMSFGDIRKLRQLIAELS